MPSLDVNILIASEEPQEIKLITMTMRGFFSECRVDAVYSADEALHWAAKEDWHVILIDEPLLGTNDRLLAELKHRLPSAAVILQSERTDSSAALTALQGGVDFYVFKNSSAFLTELLFVVQEAIEKRELLMKLHHIEERHRRLMETLPDVLYELDPDGRFVFVSPAVTALLGYTPEELTGAAYSQVLPPDQLSLARHRFNDRRAGARSTQRVALDLRMKLASREGVDRVTTEVTARGLYDPRHRFLGTLGIIRNVSAQRQQEAALRRIEQQRSDADRVLSMAQEFMTLTQAWRHSLAAVATDSEHLLRTLESLRLENQVQNLMSQAAEADRAGRELADRISQAIAGKATIEVSTLIAHAIGAERKERGLGLPIDLQVASNIPPFQGDGTRAVEMIQLLLAYAAGYLHAVGRTSGLVVAARAAGSEGSAAEVEIELTESGRSPGAPLSPDTSLPPIDPFRLFKIVQESGGRLDLKADSTGPLHIVLRFPLVPPGPRYDDVHHEGPTTPASALTQPLPPPAAKTGAAPDRRRAPRVPAALAARLIVGETAWDGTVKNIGLGGALLLSPHRPPRAKSQPVSVVIRTEASTLELQGTVRERRLEAAGGGETELVLHFIPPTPQEASVLASLLQAVQETSFHMWLDVLFPTAQPEVEQTGEPAEERDRREAIRVKLSLPVRLENFGGDTGARFLGLAINISRGGACLQVKVLREALASTITIHFAPPSDSGYRESHQPTAPDTALSADVLWSIPDPSAPGELRPSAQSHALRIGVRFHGLTPYAEHEVNRVVSQHLGSQLELGEPLERTLVVSATRECRNPRGQTIVISDDRPRRPLAPETPVVIVAPGFGQLKIDYVALSFYLAQNGLRVLRYDPTNHLGQSEGELQSTTMRSFQGDLTEMVRYVRTTWPSAPVTVLASDLAASSALKAVGENTVVDLLLLLNPVLDLRALFTAVHGHDLVADYEYGLRRGFGNLFGLNVQIDQFVADASAGSFATAASILESAGNIRNPVILIHSPGRFMEAEETANQLLSSLGPHGAAVSLPSDLAVLHSGVNPLSEFSAVLGRIRQTVSPQAVSTDTQQPSRREIARQRRIEAERLRARHYVSHASREALRTAWSQHLPLLANVSGYWRFLDDLYRALSPVAPAERVLELGCGQGELARAIVMNQAYRSRYETWSPSPPALYVGVERTLELAATAGRTTESYRRELDAVFEGTLSARPPVTMEWLCCNWDEPLPLPDETFDRVVCNLGLSFVRSPLHLVRELFRLLRPTGRLILSCFRPETDISPIYRRDLRASGQDEFDPQAQAALQFAARLREALRRGLLHSFDRYDLSALCQYSDGPPPDIFASFEGQVLIAVSRKGESSG